jgi:hypothetical protein
LNQTDGTPQSHKKIQACDSKKLVTKRKYGGNYRKILMLSIVWNDLPAELLQYDHYGKWCIVLALPDRGYNAYPRTSPRCCGKRHMLQPLEYVSLTLAWQ